MWSFSQVLSEWLTMKFKQGSNSAIGAPRHICVSVKTECLRGFKTDTLEAENEGRAGEDPYNFLTEHYGYLQVYKQLLNYYLQWPWLRYGQRGARKQPVCVQLYHFLCFLQLMSSPWLCIFGWHQSVSLSTLVVRWVIIELFGRNFFDLIEWWNVVYLEGGKRDS